MGFGANSALRETHCVRGVCLENRYTRKGIEGSNPSLSAELPKGQLTPACRRQARGAVVIGARPDIAIAARFTTKATKGSPPGSGSSDSAQEQVSREEFWGSPHTTPKPRTTDFSSPE